MRKLLLALMAATVVVVMVLGQAWPSPVASHDDGFDELQTKYALEPGEIQSTIEAELQDQRYEIGALRAEVGELEGTVKAL